MKVKDNYFGGCPECGGNDGYLNVGRNHWYICHEHKTRWLLGSNLFSSWQEQSEEDWKRNAELISDYKNVEPIFDEEATQEELKKEERRRKSSEIEIKLTDAGYTFDEIVDFCKSFVKGHVFGCMKCS